MFPNSPVDAKGTDTFIFFPVVSGKGHALMALENTANADNCLKTKRGVKRIIKPHDEAGTG
jgi:hypothetical protein